MTKFRLFLAVMVLAGICSAGAMAADKVDDNNPLVVLDKATRDMIAKAENDNQKQQFSAINGAHGIIRTVENVQESLRRGVDSCSKNNPDMKKSLVADFETWKDAVRPVMKKANSKLNKMILLQSFAQPSEIRAYLKKFDLAVQYRDQGIKMIPVTDKADCANMQASLTKSQNDIVNLMIEIMALNKDIKVKE